MAIVINGSGTVTGISVGGLPDDIVDAGTLADNAVGLAQMAGGTDGNIITYDTSGNPAVVATGSSGQVLTSAGADAVPTMATLSAGKVLQVVSMSSTTQTHTTSASYVDTDITLAITPSATSSKILAIASLNWYSNWNSANAGAINLVRTSTQLMAQKFRLQGGGLGNSIYINGSMILTYLDSPSTTSATTYKCQLKGIDSTIVRTNEDGYSSSITLMEIGA